MIALSLPYPPSANAIWRNVGGKTMVSAPYRKWKSLAFSEIVAQGAGKLHSRTIAGPYQMMALLSVMNGGTLGVVAWAADRWHELRAA